MQDNALWDVIRAIPQQTQRQYATDDQLRYLMAAANKLGLYDAADRIRGQLRDEQTNPPPYMVERHDSGTAPCTFPCEVCASRDPNYLRKHEVKQGEDRRDVRSSETRGERQ
jgi:hypothetical protein